MAIKKLHVRKDDTVIMISGDDKGKKGKVVAASPKEGKVIVEGLNLVSKHTKPRKQGETGGIVKAESAVYASKVLLYCNNCGAGRRSTFKIEDGKKIRICAKCKKEI